MRSGRIVKLLVALLALALVGASASDAATKARKYKGKTSQGKTIKFTIKGNTLTGLNFSITLDCSDGSTLTDTESGFQSTKISKNKFSDDQVGTTDEVVMSGKRKSKGKKVTGTLKVTDKLNSTVTCGPKTVKFTAKRR